MSNTTKRYDKAKRVEQARWRTLQNATTECERAGRRYYAAKRRWEEAQQAVTESLRSEPPPDTDPQYAEASKAIGFTGPCCDGIGCATCEPDPTTSMKDPATPLINPTDPKPAPARRQKLMQAVRNYDHHE